MTVALAISDLRKVYRTGLVALKGIDLRVEQGDFFALLGKNGAGKSTAIGVISSLVNKTAGEVRIFDADIDRDFARAKSYLGVVPQEFNFSIFETPLQIVCNQAGYYGIGWRQAQRRAEEYLAQLGLWEKRDAMSQTLSGGMKRRLMIARALMHRPRLLILDEPTAGVDIEIRRSMWDFLARINQEGTTIILTTHYLEEAERLCRNIAIIDHGRLVENTSTRALLATLQRETYVLDLDAPLGRLPDDIARGGDWRLRAPSEIEVEVPRDRGVSDLFEQLARHGIAVRSMRNKTNRLEQLFLELVHQRPPPYSDVRRAGDGDGDANDERADEGDGDANDDADNARAHRASDDDGERTRREGDGVHDERARREDGDTDNERERASGKSP